jgi:hypothetical protein
MFFVTDEPGSNDFGYFSTAKNPDTMWPMAPPTTRQTLANVVSYFKSNNVLLFGYVPVNTTRNCTNPQRGRYAALRHRDERWRSNPDLDDVQPGRHRRWHEPHR